MRALLLDEVRLSECRTHRRAAPSTRPVSCPVFVLPGGGVAVGDEDDEVCDRALRVRSLRTL